MIHQEISSIPVLRLKQLLHEIKDLNSDHRIRFRLMGQLWQNNYYQIVNLSESGAILREIPTGKMVSVKNLTHIAQFELDQTFREYQPNFHYNVTPN